MSAQTVKAGIDLTANATQFESGIGKAVQSLTKMDSSISKSTQSLRGLGQSGTGTGQSLSTASQSVSKMSQSLDRIRQAGGTASQSLDRLKQSGTGASREADRTGQSVAKLSQSLDRAKSSAASYGTAAGQAAQKTQQLGQSAGQAAQKTQQLGQSAQQTGQKTAAAMNQAAGATAKTTAGMGAMSAKIGTAASAGTAVAGVVALEASLSNYTKAEFKREKALVGVDKAQNALAKATTLRMQYENQLQRAIEKGNKTESELEVIRRKVTEYKEDEALKTADLTLKQEKLNIANMDYADTQKLMASSMLTTGLGTASMVAQLVSANAQTTANTGATSVNTKTKLVNAAAAIKSAGASGILAAAKTKLTAAALAATGGLKAFAGGIRATSIVMLTNPIGAVATAITAAFAALFILWKTDYGGFRGHVQNFIDMLQTAYTHIEKILLPLKWLREGLKALGIDVGATIDEWQAYERELAKIDKMERDAIITKEEHAEAVRRLDVKYGKIADSTRELTAEEQNLRVEMGLAAEKTDALGASTARLDAASEDAAAAISGELTPAIAAAGDAALDTSDDMRHLRDAARESAARQVESLDSVETALRDNKTAMYDLTNSYIEARDRGGAYLTEWLHQHTSDIGTVSEAYARTGAAVSDTMQEMIDAVTAVSPAAAAGFGGLNAAAANSAAEVRQSIGIINQQLDALKKNYDSVDSMTQLAIRNTMRAAQQIKNAYDLATWQTEQIRTYREQGADAEIRTFTGTDGQEHTNIIVTRNNDAAIARAIEKPWEHAVPSGVKLTHAQATQQANNYRAYLESENYFANTPSAHDPSIPGDGGSADAKRGVKYRNQRDSARQKYNAKNMDEARPMADWLGDIVGPPPHPSSSGGSPGRYMAPLGWWVGRVKEEYQKAVAIINTAGLVKAPEDLAPAGPAFELRPGGMVQSRSNVSIRSHYRKPSYKHTSYAKPQGDRVRAAIAEAQEAILEGDSIENLNQLLMERGAHKSQAVEKKTRGRFGRSSRGRHEYEIHKRKYDEYMRRRESAADIIAARDRLVNEQMRIFRAEQEAVRQAALEQEERERQAAMAAAEAEQRRADQAIVDALKRMGYTLATTTTGTAPSPSAAAAPSPAYDEAVSYIPHIITMQHLTGDARDARAREIASDIGTSTLRTIESYLHDDGVVDSGELQQLRAILVQHHGT